MYLCLVETAIEEESTDAHPDSVEEQLVVVI